jgi:multicomponent Na+:H+ antiporter subunit C
MIPVIATSVFILLSAGVYLLLQKSWLRVVIGLGLIAHAMHLILLSAGRPGGLAPVLLTGAGIEGVTDPLPQAFVLTAIVIAMAMTIYLFAAMAALARRGKRMDVDPTPDGDEGREEASGQSDLEESERTGS